MQSADQDPRPASDAISYMKMQSVLRMVILKVMYENNIDVFVNPEQTTPPYKLGGPGEPEVNDRPTISCCTGFTALFGGPEMEVPAGYAEIVLRPDVRADAGQEGLRRSDGSGRIDAAASDADQHDVLGRPRERFVGDQGGIGIRIGDAPSRAAGGIRPASGKGE